MLQAPLWLLKLLPMWDYICPKCRKEVQKESRRCIYCGENYDAPLRVPPKILKDSKALEAYVHKHIFPKVSALQREYLAQFFTVILQDCFESGDLSAWTGTTVTVNDVCAVLPGIAHHGIYGLRSSVDDADNDNAFVYKTLTAASTYYVRMYVRFNVLLGPSGGKKGNLLSLWNSGDSNTPIAWVAVTDSQSGLMGWYGLAHSGAASLLTEVTASGVCGVWRCVELKGVASLTVGEVRVYIDGVEQVALTGLNMGYTTIDSVRVGFTSKQTTGGTKNPESADIDCVVIADTYIGCEAIKTALDLHGITADDEGNLPARERSNLQPLRLGRKKCEAPRGA
jgi:hypothetical protein